MNVFYQLQSCHGFPYTRQVSNPADGAVQLLCIPSQLNQSAQTYIGVQILFLFHRRGVHLALLLCNERFIRTQSCHSWDKCSKRSDGVGLEALKPEGTSPLASWFSGTSISPPIIPLSSVSCEQSRQTSETQRHGGSLALTATELPFPLCSVLWIITGKWTHSGDPDHRLSVFLLYVHHHSMPQFISREVGDPVPDKQFFAVGVCVGLGSGRRGGALGHWYDLGEWHKNATMLRAGKEIFVMVASIRAPLAHVFALWSQVNNEVIMLWFSSLISTQSHLDPCSNKT